MRSDKYREFFTGLMGPNSLRLLDELLETCPPGPAAGDAVLDLGCGTGVTSLFLARETGAKVYACDLWISEEDNRKRFSQWQMQDRLIPVHADARALPFEKEMFDTLISVDAYHYFGGTEGFFAEKILPCLKTGGTALIAVPGIKAAYDGQSEALLKDWAGEEAYMFQSAAFWKRVIGSGGEIEAVRTWEMEGFDLPWQEWFATKHPYALNDKAFYETMIRPYTAFVGIMVKKR